MGREPEYEIVDSKKVIRYPTARLEILGFDVSVITPFIRYLDDGFVLDLKKHWIKLAGDYKDTTDIIPECDRFYQGINGFARSFCKYFTDPDEDTNNEGSYYYHIFYKDSGDTNVNIAIRAFLETIVLQCNSFRTVDKNSKLQKLHGDEFWFWQTKPGIELLENGLRETFRSRVPLGVLDRRVISGLGSVYALKNRGIDPRDVPYNHPGFREALKMCYSQRPILA